MDLGAEVSAPRRPRHRRTVRGDTVPWPVRGKPVRDRGVGSRRGPERGADRPGSIGVQRDIIAEARAFAEKS